jgi:hypothetical protein
MGCKLLVALHLDVPHQFIKGIAGRRGRSVEPPGAFGAPVTAKTLGFDPYKLAGHPPTEGGLRHEALSSGESLGGGDKRRGGRRNCILIQQSCCQAPRVQEQELRWGSDAADYSFYTQDLLPYNVTFVIVFYRAQPGPATKASVLRCPRALRWMPIPSTEETMIIGANCGSFSPIHLATAH